MGKLIFCTPFDYLIDKHTGVSWRGLTAHYQGLASDHDSDDPLVPRCYLAIFLCHQAADLHQQPTIFGLPKVSHLLFIPNNLHTASCNWAFVLLPVMSVLFFFILGDFSSCCIPVKNGQRSRALKRIVFLSRSTFDLSRWGSKSVTNNINVPVSRDSDQARTTPGPWTLLFTAGLSRLYAFWEKSLFGRSKKKKKNGGLLSSLETKPCCHCYFFLSQILDLGNIFNLLWFPRHIFKTSTKTVLWILEHFLLSLENLFVSVVSAVRPYNQISENTISQ